MPNVKDKVKNFLFIVPRFAPKNKFYTFPIGMAYVISSMQKNNFNVFCLNLCHSDEPVEEQIKSAVEGEKIDIICTGGMSMHWNLLKDMLGVIKKNYPDKIIVVGGSIMTSEPQVAMENLPIDFGVIGEGEITMSELAAELCAGKLEPESVNGIIYRSSSGELITTGKRGPVMDLDSLPMPAYEMLGYEQHLSARWDLVPALGGITFGIDENQRLGEIATSRSCPYSCTFCYHPLGNKYRQRSLDNVFEEIDFLVKKYNIRVFNLLDELFSLKEDRIREFCRRIKPYNVYWTAQWRVNNTNRELLKEVKDSGLCLLGLGVESMSDTILRSMKKYTSAKQVDAAFKLAAELGITAGGNLIFGDINETEETVNESLKWFFAHPEYDLNLAMIRSIPDSEIWRYTVEKGVIKDKKEFFENSLPLINFSKLSDKAYSRCMDLSTAYTWLCFTLKGKVLESTRLPELYEGKKVYRFKIECPKCKAVSEYKHYPTSTRPRTAVLCKSCFKKLAVDTRRLFNREYGLIARTYINQLRLFYILHLKPIGIFYVLGKCLKQLAGLIRINKKAWD